MSNTDDPIDPLVARLLAEEGPDRVFYALGTMLGADDFQDEQLYHRGRLARALAYLFGSGTVAGLKIDATFVPEDPAQNELRVAPGLAIDGFGRLIEVPRRACIRIQRWLASQPYASLQGALSVDGDRVFAWLQLRFRACERGKTPVLAQGPCDATNAVAPARLRDGYELRLFLDAPPEPTWSTPAAEFGNPAWVWELKQRILDDWPRPTRLADATEWVLLARVEIPIEISGDKVLYRAGERTVCVNEIRPFAIGPRVMGLVPREEHP